MSKIKLQIKNRFTGSVLFEYESENNTVKETVINAVKIGADLGGAYLRGAYLRGAYLRGADLGGADLGGADLRGAYLGGADLGGADLGGADLRGAYLGGAYLGGADLRGAYLGGADLGDYKIKVCTVITGLYQYVVMPIITEDGQKRIKMGCHNRSLEEWEANFWNNDEEFANNGSIKSNLRLLAYNTAKEWLKLQD